MKSDNEGRKQLSFVFQTVIPATSSAQDGNELIEADAKPLAAVICLASKKREATKAAIIASVKESGVFSDFEEA